MCCNTCDFEDCGFTKKYKNVNSLRTKHPFFKWKIHALYMSYNMVSSRDNLKTLKYQSVRGRQVMWLEIWSYHIRQFI